jgi:hypothetical protein
LTEIEPATEGQTPAPPSTELRTGPSTEPKTSETDIEEAEWPHPHNGELPDTNTMSALRLAHRAVEKFPDLAKRYQKYVGGAAVLSSVVIVLASIAISRRLHKGESPEQILASITSEEIESMAHQKTENPKKPRRGITRFLP